MTDSVKSKKFELRNGELYYRLGERDVSCWYCMHSGSNYARVLASKTASVVRRLIWSLSHKILLICCEVHSEPD